MKRNKKLWVSIVAVLCSLTIVFATACTDSCSPEDDSSSISTMGIDVTLAEGVSDTIELSSEQKTASIDASKIVVKHPATESELATTAPMDSSRYTVDLYKAQEKLTATEGTTYSGLAAGVYQIVATTTVNSQEVWGFALIYVVDNVTSLAWNSTAEGTVATQEEGSKDLITETLKFTATYASGATKEVSSDSVTFSTAVETLTVGENKTATATYTEENQKGEDKTTTEATVTYTVTEKVETNSATFFIEDLSTFESVADNGIVTTNLLFEMKTEKAMEFTTSLTSNQPTYTPDSRPEYKVTKGLKQTGDTDPGAVTPSIIFTAQQAISIKVYVVLANDSFNSHRPGTLHYTIGDGQTTDEATTNRNNMVTVSADLAAGETLTINYTNNHASSKAKIWFFGAEAEVKATATVTSTYSLVVDELVSNTDTNNQILTQDNFTGTNAFIKVVETSDNFKWRTDSNHCIEIRGGSIAVDFEGTGTLSITFRSPSSSENAFIKLIGPDGNWVAATIPDGSTAKDSGEGRYEVNNTYQTVVFTITAAGRYTIFGNGFDSQTGAEESRSPRINAIVMVDNH